MQRILKAGHAADAGLIFHIFAMDSASITGAGKASIAYSSWTCRYIRAGGAISGAITPQDITTIGTYAAPTANTNIRIKAVDNTNMIGVYELQLHLDWVATGSESLTLFLTATGVAPITLTIPLVAVNPQDSVRAGMTALPNAAADAAGGLPISDAGGLDLDTKLANTNEVTAARMGALTDWINGGRLDLILDIIAADTTTDIPALIATAQADLDTITGADGVTLATAQALYAPAKVSDLGVVQTGDSYAYLGTNLGALGANATEAGGTGDHLTAVPWNAAWDAEAQSEAADALAAYDPPTNTEMVAAFTEIKGATWATTDTLEAIRDRGDSAWLTATGFATPTNITAGTITTVTNLTNLPGTVQADVTSILADTNELQTNQGAWATATGFATEAKQDIIDGIVDQILADTGTDGVVLSTSTLQAAADALLDRADGVEPASAGTERTVREALRILLAACAGKLSGAATTTIAIRDTNDAKARITATVDADGNRSAVTLDDT